MADDTSSLSFLRRHPFWWFLIGPAGAAGSVWGKRLGEDRPLLGYIVFILGVVLIAIGHGWAINWAYDMHRRQLWEAWVSDDPGVKANLLAPDYSTFITAPPPSRASVLVASSWFSRVSQSVTP